jgi:hypothetical protein
MRLSSFAAIVLWIAALPVVAGASPDHWNVTAKLSKSERYLGRDALLLDEGTAWLDDANFQDGVIEFDVAASGEAGYHGLAFRAADHDNYESVYLRSQLSDKPDATQYTPVFNGLSGWQIYAGPRFIQPVTIVPDRWVHVRVIVRGARLELSVDGKTRRLSADAWARRGGCGGAHRHGITGTLCQFHDEAGRDASAGRGRRGAGRGHTRGCRHALARLDCV